METFKALRYGHLDNLSKYISEVIYFKKCCDSQIWYRYVKAVGRQNQNRENLQRDLGSQE